MNIDRYDHWLYWFMYKCVVQCSCYDRLLIWEWYVGHSYEQAADHAWLPTYSCHHKHYHKSMCGYSSAKAVKQLKKHRCPAIRIGASIQTSTSYDMLCQNQMFFYDLSKSHSEWTNFVQCKNEAFNLTILYTWKWNIKVSDMKVWVLRIISVFTLIIIIIGLFCQTKIWTPIKNQLLGDSQGKKDFKLRPTDETIMHRKIVGGGSDSLKNLERDSKREKLAPLFSQRISLLKEVQHVISILIKMRIVIFRHAARWMTRVVLIRSQESGASTLNISWYSTFFTRIW